MSEEVGAKALRLGVERNAGSCGIVFFGGEPLLARERIGYLVDVARGMANRGEGMFHFKVTTNGMLLDEEFLEYAGRNDILIAMSFDGVRQAHDAHRRTADGRGTFDLLMPKLRMLLEARPYSSILMVVNPDTAKHLVESVSFLLDEGARYLIVSMNYDSSWDEEGLAVLEKQYRRLAKLYVKWAGQGRKFYLSPFEVKIATHVNWDKAECLCCDLGMRQLSVDPEGYLYPCVQFSKAGRESRWCIGDVDRGIDPRAWARMRNAVCHPKEPCNGCAIRRRCMHTCACLNWQTTGAVDKVCAALCNHERMLIPIADWIAETLYAKRNKRFFDKHYDEAYPVLSLLEDHLSGA